MDKKKLAEQTSVLSKYTKLLRESEDREERLLYIGARSLANAHKEISEDYEDVEKSIGVGGAVELLYALSRFISANHKDDWNAIIEDAQIRV